MGSSQLQAEQLPGVACEDLLLDLGAVLPEQRKPDVPWATELWDEGPDEWISRGNTAIVGPEGELLAGPLREQEGILYAELDLATLHTQRRQFDPVGHYARPDLFRLQVDVTPHIPVELAVADPKPEEIGRSREHRLQWAETPHAYESDQPGRATEETPHLY